MPSSMRSDRPVPDRSHRADATAEDVYALLHDGGGRITQGRHTVIETLIAAGRRLTADNWAKRYAPDGRALTSGRCTARWIRWSGLAWCATPTWVMALRTGSCSTTTGTSCCARTAVRWPTCPRCGFGPRRTDARRAGFRVGDTPLRTVRALCGVRGGAPGVDAARVAPCLCRWFEDEHRDSPRTSALRYALTLPPVLRSSHGSTLEVTLTKSRRRPARTRSIAPR